MNRVYNNYFFGSVSQISKCYEIILFNKSEFKEMISLYNLENFYTKNLIGNSTKFVRIYRGSAELPFEYKKQLPEGFNIIVYISNVSGSPIGYAEFMNIQGVGVALNITISISRSLAGQLELIIENKLVGKDLYRKYTGKELYEYSTIGEIRDKSYRNLFTSDVGRTESDLYGFIMSLSGFITKSENWRLKVKKNTEIDSGLSNYNICFYNGSLVLSAWGGSSYKIYPLVGTGDIIEGSTNREIKRIEGRYYFDTEGNLLDLVSGVMIEKNKKILVCDFLDPHCPIYDLPTFYSSSTILKYIPEINNIYLDLNNYLKSGPITIHSKIGSWFALETDYGGVSLYTVVSPTSVIYMTEKDLEKAIFVGDQTIIIHELGDGDHEGYYMIYNTSETQVYTERAREVLLNGRLDWWDDQFRFCYLDTDEDVVHFDEYYGNDMVPIIYENEELSNTALMKYRRNVYPVCDGIPNLVGSYGGLIFYEINHKINYL